MKITIDEFTSRCDEGSIPTPGFINGLIPLCGPNIDYIIPNGVKLIRHVRGNTYFVIEIEPQLHSFTVSTAKRGFVKNSDVEPSTYRIAMPWVIIIGCIHNRNSSFAQLGFNECYFMTSRLEEPLDQPLFAPALLNCQYNGAKNPIPMCLGYLDHSSTLPGAIGVVREAFFNRRSNYSIGEPAHYIYRETPIGDMRKWEEMSLADPYFVLSFPWKKMGYTLAARLPDAIHLDFTDLTRTVFNHE